MHSQSLPRYRTRWRLSIHSLNLTLMNILVRIVYGTLRVTFKRLKVLECTYDIKSGLSKTQAPQQPSLQQNFLETAAFEKRRNISSSSRRCASATAAGNPATASIVPMWTPNSARIQTCPSRSAWLKLALQENKRHFHLQPQTKPAEALTTQSHIH